MVKDMDDTVSPLDAGLAVDGGFRHDPARLRWQRRCSLPQAQEMLGPILDDKGVLRCPHEGIHQPGEGETSSGSFSPTLKNPSPLPACRSAPAQARAVEVEIRGKRVAAHRETALARNGKVLAA